MQTLLVQALGFLRGQREPVCNRSGSVVSGTTPMTDPIIFQKTLKHLNRSWEKEPLVCLDIMSRRVISPARMVKSLSHHNGYAVLGGLNCVRERSLQDDVSHATLFFTGISWDDDTGRRFGGSSGSSYPAQCNFTGLSAILSSKAKLSPKEDFGGEGARRVEQVGLKTSL